MPYITVDIDLDEIDDDDMVNHLRRNGYTVIDSNENFQSCEEIVGADLARIEHLSVCGQVEQARIEALAIVSKAIGRTL